VRLEAPGAGIDAPVVEVFLEDGAWQVADYAVGYHHGTGLPGDGNIVMAGHKGVRGAVFAQLERLKVGADVFVDAAGQRFHYRVRTTGNVWPSNVAIMYPTPLPTLTLLTCTNWDTQRFVVIADLVDSAKLPLSTGG
jgi:sortase A